MAAGVDPGSGNGSDRGADTEIARDVLVFWERGRLIFNGVLGILTVVLLIDRFEPPPALVDYVAFLALCALGANLVYCAAYPVDLVMQVSEFRARWRHLRWGVLAFGTLIGCAGAWMVISVS